MTHEIPERNKQETNAEGHSETDPAHTEVALSTVEQRVWEELRSANRGITDKIASGEPLSDDDKRKRSIVLKAAQLVDTYRKPGTKDIYEQRGHDIEGLSDYATALIAEAQARDSTLARELGELDEPTDGSEESGEILSAIGANAAKLEVAEFLRDFLQAKRREAAAVSIDPLESSVSDSVSNPKLSEDEKERKRERAAIDVQISAFSTVDSQISTAAHAFEEASTLEAMHQAREELRSASEVKRVLADFMPEMEQTVGDWFAKRRKEIEDDYEQGSTNASSRSDFMNNLAKAQKLLLASFK